MVWGLKNKYFGMTFLSINPSKPLCIACKPFVSCRPRRDARSVYNARGSRAPRVLNGTGQVVPCLWWSEAPLRGRRVSRRVKSYWGCPSGRQVGSKIAFFGTRSVFLAHFFAARFEVAFLSVFRWLFNGFWSVLGKLLECFGNVFPCF